jgi:hypothetical protein
MHIVLALRDAHERWLPVRIEVDDAGFHELRPVALATFETSGTLSLMQLYHAQPRHMGMWMMSCEEMIREFETGIASIGGGRRNGQNGRNGANGHKGGEQ